MGSWHLRLFGYPYHSRGDLARLVGGVAGPSHAYGCAHAVWFREHLPLEVWKLRRFEALRASDPHWAEKYAVTCEIIRRDMLGSFEGGSRLGRARGRPPSIPSRFSPRRAGCDRKLQGLGAATPLCSVTPQRVLKPYWPPIQK